MELTDKQDEAMVKAFSAAAQQRPSIGITAFKAGYTAAVNRECAWTEVKADDPQTWQLKSGCGFQWVFDGYGVSDDGFLFCPNCGGKVVEVKDDTAN